MLRFTPFSGRGFSLQHKHKNCHCQCHTIRFDCKYIRAFLGRKSHLSLSVIAQDSLLEWINFRKPGEISEFDAKKAPTKSCSANILKTTVHHHKCARVCVCERERVEMERTKNDVCSFAASEWCKWSECCDLHTKRKNDFFICRRKDKVLNSVELQLDIIENKN